MKAIDRLWHSDTIESTLWDYYTASKSLTEVCEAEGVKYPTFYTYIKSRGLKTYKGYHASIDTGVKELDARLKVCYMGIVRRCKGRPSYKYSFHYEKHAPLPIYEWVEFCNENREVLLRLWNYYIESGSQYKHSVSVDRIDNSKGYSKNNLQFVTTGFNSWKRNINPVKLDFDSKEYYCMTIEEAAGKIGVSRALLSQVLRKVKNFKKYKVTLVSKDKVLKENNVSSIEEYHEKICEGGIVNDG